MKKVYLAAALTGIMSVLAMTGCGQISSLTEQVKEGLESATVVKTDSLDLYNNYIDLNNLMVGRIDESLNDYFSDVVFQEAFETTDPDYSCYSIFESDVELIDSTYEVVNAKETKDTLDNAYLSLYPSMKELVNTLNEIYKYTDLKSYMDDDYAKGKELHTALWTAYNEYEGKSPDFFSEVDNAAKLQQEKDLVTLKEAGHVTLYSMNVVMNTAREIQDAIFNQSTEEGAPEALDLTEIEPLYARYATEVEECLTNLENKEQLEKEGISGAFLSMFITSLKDSKTSLTELIQQVKNQEPFEDYIDTIEEFDDALSEMIDRYNSL